MQLVEQAIEHPGCCALTGTSTGPFVQLDRPLGMEAATGGTAYVSADLILEAARKLGLQPAHQNDALRAQVRELEESLASLQDEYDELVAAVGTTLQHGAVARNGAVELRKPLARKRRG
jgi:hypothetical protein